MLPQGEVSKKVPLSRANRQRAHQISVQQLRQAGRRPIPWRDGVKQFEREKKQARSGRG